MKAFEIGNQWLWDVERDQYSKNGITITRSVVEDKMKNWGRPIHRVHILAVLDNLYKCFSPGEGKGKV